MRFEMEDPTTPSGGRRLSDVTGKRRKKRRHRSFEMLPTVITLGNLFSGFLAIAYLTDSLHTLDASVRTGLHLKAVLFIFLAMVFDALDGKVARMMGQTSRFGELLDSICDAVSFGAAPALLFKVVVEADPWVVSPRIALTIAVVFLACAVLRLARFNVETTPDPESHRWFKGLPTPAAASVVASLVYLNAELDPAAQSWVRYALPPVTVLLGILMVSHVRYRHAASWLFSRKSYQMLVVLIFVAAAVVAWYELLLPALCVGFMLSGPASAAVQKLRSTREVPKTAEAGPDGGVPPPAGNP